MAQNLGKSIQKRRSILDSAEAYELNADKYLKYRNRNTGRKVIQQWVRNFPPYSEILELGCGDGIPVSEELLKVNVKLWAIDSSPTMINKFRSRFPDVAVKCERVQESDFFNKAFNGVVAIGLIFLLTPEEQETLISRIAETLMPGGHFLVSCPAEKGVWEDEITGIQCLSLGKKEYQKIFERVGLRLIDTYVDEGNNYYYSTRKLSK